MKGLQAAHEANVSDVLFSPSPVWKKTMPDCRFFAKCLHHWSAALRGRGGIGVYITIHSLLARSEGQGRLNKFVDLFGLQLIY